MSTVSEWWTGLSVREKWLIGTAGALVAVLLFWQAILVPGLSWRADQKARMETAFRSMETLQRAYFEERAAGEIIVVESEKRQVLTGEPFKAAIIQAATDGGLSISRLQTSGADTVSITVDRADPRIVFYWLQKVEIEAGAVITRMVMETSVDDQVRVSVDFESLGA
ncbi:MAG: type II secretion system protein GspM [Pseudomonadota bacterium]